MKSQKKEKPREIFNPDECKCWLTGGSWKSIDYEHKKKVLNEARPKKYKELKP